jgi:peptidyl-tRNA hydrolase, PTH1 family
MPPLSVSGAALLVGLGTPGRSYEKTRHNAGFLALDEISNPAGIPLGKSKYDTLFGRGTIEGTDVILAKPMAFMNNSGPPIQKLARFFRIPVSNLLVIHDDIDLMFGRLKIKEKGGHGGHKGIESLSMAFGTGDFHRFRIGVGRPKTRSHVTDHVLGRFTRDEEQVLGKIITSTREGIILLLKKGLTEGMNQINNRKLLISH